MGKLSTAYVFLFCICYFLFENHQSLQLAPSPSPAQFTVSELQKLLPIIFLRFKGAAVFVLPHIPT